MFLFNRPTKDRPKIEDESSSAPSAPKGGPATQNAGQGRSSPMSAHHTHPISLEGTSTTVEDEIHMAEGPIFCG